MDGAKGSDVDRVVEGTDADDAKSRERECPPPEAVALTLDPEPLHFTLIYIYLNVERPRKAVLLKAAKSTRSRGTLFIQR